MKNNELTSKYSRDERSYFALLMMAILIAVMLLTSLTACTATKWADSINNPVNAEYVIQTAMDYDVPTDSVTQKMFNIRYTEGNTPAQIAEIIKQSKK